MAKRFPIYSGREIGSVDGWFILAPPAGGEKQWVDGRSAKELARRWVDGEVPSEVARVLDTRPELKSFRPAYGFAEVKTALDDFPGNTRNDDLVLVGLAAGGRTVVAVEGKADEPFGSRTIGEEISKASPTSNVPTRIDRLAKGLFGRPGSALPALRYQLLHALGASLIRSGQEEAVQAVLLIHEFRFPGVVPEALDRNATALDLLVELLAGSRQESLKDGGIAGPFRVPGNSEPEHRIPKDLPVYVAKAVVRA